MRYAAAAFCGVLACCAPQAAPASHLAMIDIQPILEPLAYRELLGKKCGVQDTALKTAFIADLKVAGASLELLTEAGAEADRIAEAERDTPNEYVCTAELFESTEKNAAAAQAAWTELKKRKS